MGGQVHKIYKMIELNEIHTLTAKNSRSFDDHHIINISIVLYKTHVIPRNYDKFVFYVNNCTDWDELNQLYDPDWMTKDVGNTNTIARKLGPALRKVTNQKLEVVREKMQRKEEIVEKRKVKTMTAKRPRVKRRISLSNE